METLSQHLALWVNLAISAVTALLTLAFYHGSIKVKIESLEKDCEDCKEDKRNKTESYVTMTHFREVIDNIREDQRELKTDVKHIISMLTQR